MQKIRTLGSKPAAAVVMLVLLGITAHAAVIPLVQVITSRDDFFTIAGAPDLTVDFDNQPDGFTNRINFLRGTITGDILVQSRAINFSSPGSLAFSFDSNISAWGTDISSIGGPGLINFSVNGLSALCPHQLHVARVYRFLLPDIRRIAVQRRVLTLGRRPGRT